MRVRRTGFRGKLGGVPVLTSDEYNIYELVSVTLRGLLRHLMALPSRLSRHCDVQMPGLVSHRWGSPMDERIRNLMRGRGHQDLLMTVDDPELEGKLLAALEKR